MPESRPISVRAPKDVHDRVEAAAYRALCTKSEWVLAALEVQLDIDEQVTTEPVEPVEPVVESYVYPRSKMAVPMRRLPSVH